MNERVALLLAVIGIPVLVHFGFGGTLDGLFYGLGRSIVFGLLTVGLIFLGIRIYQWFKSR